MAYGYFKYLPILTASDKILRVNLLTLLKIQNMMDIKEVFPLIFNHQNYLVTILQVVLLHVQINLLLNVKLCQLNH